MSRILNASWILPLVCATVVGAEAPTYDRPVDFHLDGIAETLDVSPAKLLDARISLRRLTEKPNVIMPAARANLGFLIRPWVGLDPDSAPGALSFLFDRIREQALLARESSRYDCATMRATDLVGVMLNLAPQRAQELARTWPEPAAEMEPAAWDHYRHFWDQVRATSLSEVAQVDADRALKLVAEGAYPFSAEARGVVVSRLWAAGRGDEALELARRVILDYRAMPVDSAVAADFSRFVDELLPFAVRPFHKDLFREAWTLALTKDGGLPETLLILETGDAPSVGFSVPEVTGLYQLAVLEKSDRGAWLARDLLESIPGLKERVGRSGGLERIGLLVTGVGLPYPDCCRMTPRRLREPFPFNHVVALPHQWDGPIDANRQYP